MRQLEDFPVRIASIPLDLLLDWRSPDRDIHRALVTQGAMTTTELRYQLGLSAMSTAAALDRMERLGVVRSVRVRSGLKYSRLCHADYVPSRAKCLNGQTLQRSSQWSGGRK